MYKTSQFLFFILFVSCFLPATSFAYTFPRDLFPRMRGADVFALQIFLNTNPQTQVAAFGPGSPNQETSYYGQLTAQAVYRFQASQPGVREHDGVLHGSTREALNQISNFPLTSQLSPPASQLQQGYGAGAGAGNGFGQLPSLDSQLSPLSSQLQSPGTPPGNGVSLPFVSAPQLVQPGLQQSLLGGFNVTPTTLNPGDQATISWNAANSVYYQVRLDCPTGVTGDSSLNLQLCGGVNVLRANASPFTIRFSNSTGLSQQVVLTLSAHDGAGNLLATQSQLITLSSASTSGYWSNGGYVASQAGAPFTVLVDNVADDGSTVIPIYGFNSLSKNITIYGASASGYNLGYAPSQNVSLSVTAASGLITSGQVSVLPASVTVPNGQSAAAQFTIPNITSTPGDYRVTVTAQGSTGYTVIKNFTVRVGNGSGYQSSATLPDLSISYAGLTSVARGTTYTPYFNVRELNNVGAAATAGQAGATQVQASLYDLMYQTGTPGVYGYTPQAWNDTNHVLASTLVNVTPGYNNSALYISGGFTFQNAGRYNVCASIDTLNQLQETTKVNNITCTTVQVN